jgi:hypothetical protein
LVYLLILPDGLNLEKLILEDLDGLASLEIVVFKDISSSGRLPVADTGRIEIGIA